MPSNPPQGPIQGELMPAPGLPATNSLAVISLIMGILSIILAAGSLLLTFVCCSGLPFMALGLILGVAAAICGHVALRQLRATNQRGREFAIAGCITGYVGAGLSILVILLLVVLGGLIAVAAATGQMEAH